VKKIISLLLIVLFAVANTAATYATPGTDITIYVNRQLVPSNYAPVIVNGRVLVPLRTVADGLGVRIDWNADIRAVHIWSGQIYNNSITGDNWINGTAFYVDNPWFRDISRCLSTGFFDYNRAYPLDIGATIINSRTYVPIRAVAYAMGLSVNWCPLSRRVSIEETWRF